MDIWIFLLCLLLGLLVGWLGDLPNQLPHMTNIITKSSLAILLFSMGAKIGTNDNIIRHIGQIGIQSLSFALGSIFGSILFVKILTITYPFVDAEKKDEISKKEEGNGVIPILIVGSVLLGGIVGFCILPEHFTTYLEQVTTYALGVLLFGIGIDLGIHKEMITKPSFGYEILLLPVLIALGSIFGGILVGYLLAIPLNEAAAVGAGFGWYSFSGILLTELHSVRLGLIAFLSNVLRELFSIVLCPLVAKHIGRMESIAPGGATTMDVTLPVVKESAGVEFVLPAFFSGFVLTGLVPILVPFLIRI